MGLKEKGRKMMNIAGTYGTGYLVKRTAFQMQMKKEPDREILFEEYRGLIAPTPKQEKAQREIYAGRTGADPMFIVCIEKSGDDADLQASKDSIRCQTYMPQKALLGTRENICQRLKEILPKFKDRNLWIIKMTAGDQMSPDMLFALQEAIKSDESVDIWYADHVTANGTAFKPDYSMDYLCSWNYIGDTFAARASVYDAGNLYEDAYLTLLGCAADGRGIAHVHTGYFTKKWEYECKAPADETDALSALIYRIKCGEKLEGISVLRNGDVKNVSLKWKGDTKISVIIPNKDHAEDLNRCLKAISRQSAFQYMDICVVENNSADPFTDRYYDYITGRDEKNLPGSLRDDELKNKLAGHIRVIKWDGQGFNYPAINNYGVENTTGEYLLFLNNDVELTDRHIVENMLGHAGRPDVTAVGTRLSYPDGTVQHGGVVIGMGGVADHIYTGIPAHSVGYLHGNVCTRDVSAVTAACMMVRRKDFNTVGGFDENFRVNFNDVDLCLKLIHHGRIIIIPGEAVHYESKTRGKGSQSDEEKKNYEAEVALFKKRYSAQLKTGDRYYNRNLTLSRKDFSCGNPFMFDEK